MKTKSLQQVSLALFLVGAVGLAQASNTVIVKAGQHSLSKERQPSIEYLNETATFEKDSSAVGLEYEWRTRQGFAIGGEYVEFSHDWRGPFGTSGDLDAFTFMVNAKKYFTVAEWFLPYVGIGIGFGGALYNSSNLVDEEALVGFATQVTAGVEFRFGRVGLFTQVKRLSSKIEDGYDEQIDISGTTLFGGLAVHF